MRGREVFTSYGDVARLWVHQSQEFARYRAGKFYFRGSVIYSYGSHFPIAKLLPDGKTALFTTQEYSNTTSSHKSVVHRALKTAGKEVLYCRDPDNCAHSNGMVIKNELDALYERILNSRREPRLLSVRYDWDDKCDCSVLKHYSAYSVVEEQIERYRKWLDYFHIHDLFNDERGYFNTQETPANAAKRLVDEIIAARAERKRVKAESARLTRNEKSRMKRQLRRARIEKERLLELKRQCARVAPALIDLTEIEENYGLSTQRVVGGRRGRDLSNY